MNKKYSHILPLLLHKKVNYNYNEKLPKPMAIMGYTNMYCKAVEKGMLGSAKKQREELAKFTGIEGFIFTKYQLNNNGEDFMMYSIMPESLKGNDRKKTVYYIHGGAFYFPLGVAAIKSCAYMAEQLDAIVFLPDYHVSTDHPYPLPLLDCKIGYEYILKNSEELGIDTEKLFMYGDSAGGCLAASLNIMLRDENIMLPKVQTLIFPVTDNDNEYPSNKEYEYAVWPENCNEHMWDVYLKDAKDLKYAIPMKCDNLQNLPPTYLEVGEADLLRDQGLSYAKRLTDAGNTVKTRIIPGGYHGYTGDLENEYVKEILNNQYQEMTNLLNS